MEFEAKLIKDNMVKITVQKRQKDINHKSLQKLLKLRAFNLLAAEQKETRYIYYFKTRNKPLAVVSAGNIFRSLYNLLKNPIPLEAFSDLQKSVDILVNKNVHQT